MENKNDEINNFFDEDETFETITMTDEDGIETDFVIIDAIEVDKTKYLLVVSADEAESDEPEATILKEVNSNKENSYYEFIEDDNEFKKVSVLLQDNDPDYKMEF